MKKRILIISIIMLAALILPACAQTRLYAVNVGKGDALIIQAGDCNVLIDTGKGYACGRLRRAFEELGITRLDAVFITHVDSDHIEGLQFLTESGIEVGAWYASPYFFEYKEKKHPLRKLGIEPEWLEAGDEVGIGAVRFCVLAPLTKDEDDEDENSLVIMLETPDGRILLTGDMEHGEEAALLATDCSLKCDILKVANHGDDDTTSAEFIARTGAECAVISTDSAEKPGTPDPGVVAALESAGADVFVTQDSDAICASLDGGRVTAEYVYWERRAVDGVELFIDQENELFTLFNSSDADISLDGWYVYSDAGNELYIFGAELLPAGGSIVLGTKSSPDGAYDIYWDEKNVISDKKADLISLYDRDGNLMGSGY